MTSEFGTSAAAKEAIDILMEMSRLLNTGLDKETLIICTQLLEMGMNPEALASVVTTLRAEAAKIKAEESPS
ncbi:mitotic-spindle organizing protein 1-like [Convolutriloba macropyga]|uniref:mitotic-spindle organizing protein 1-like n=1 Tax=Convolutriloba macropyga TaxID=536237 RepID=UPI003F52062C